MDGIYPNNYCSQFPSNCNSLIPDRTWIGTNFIRNRGLTTDVTKFYDDGYPSNLTNNPPPVPIYVRIGQSLKNPNEIVYWINGYERPRLILTRGKKYQFNVNTFNYPFYLTNDKDGGDNLSYVKPSSYFVQTFTINDKLPSKFYYECLNKKYMGGDVIIK